MRKILYAWLILLSTFAQAQQGTAVPFKPVNPEREDRANLWYDNVKKQFFARVKQGNTFVDIPFGSTTVINGKTAVNGQFSLSAADLGLPADSTNPIKALAPSMAKKVELMSITELRANNSNGPPAVVQITDRGRAGTYTLLTNPPIGVQDNTAIYILTAKGKVYMRDYNGPLDVRWFGADPTDDLPDHNAVQAAINYARSLGTYTRKVIYFPGGGIYYIAREINATDCPGLYFLGEGGRYVNSVLRGNTGGKIIDATGSTFFGMENIQLSSQNGTPSPSTIGIQLALSKNSGAQSVAGAQKGGLNPILNNVTIELANLPTANGGLGTIAILNIRAEEAAFSNVSVIANCGAIFSNRLDLLSTTGISYTASSNFMPIQDDGNGSMGVVNWSSGQNSIKLFEKLSPALLLNGTNNISFVGYFGRIYVDPGRNDANENAVACYQYSRTVSVKATIEGLSRGLYVRNQLENSNFDLTMANQSNPSVSVIQLEQGSQLLNDQVSVTFGNPSEHNNGRVLLGIPSQSNGDEPLSNTAVRNCRFYCSTWVDNALLMPLNLARVTTTSYFYTVQPVAYDQGLVRQLYSVKTQAGTIGSIVASSVSRFLAADRATKTSNNAGSYTIKVQGTMIVGNEGDGHKAIASFTAYLVMGQGSNSYPSPVATNVIIHSNTTTYAAAQRIAGITATLDTSNPSMYRILLVPTVSGANASTPIYFDTVTEVRTDFKVNGTMLFF